VAEETVGMLRVVLSAKTDEFSAGLQGATAKLNSFEREAKNASRTLSRLGDDFSGQRIAAQAAVMAEAVTRAGGAVRLTGVELTRVRSVIDAATEKFRALGQTVPPAIDKIEKEIRELDAAARQTTELGKLQDRLRGVDSAASQTAAGGLSRFTGALGMVGRFLPVLTMTGAVAGLGRLATQAVESASKIQDLSNKLGVSTDAIQEMQVVANQTGSSVETFASAAFRLGVNVSEGGKKAREAIAGLGLEYERLRALKPEDMQREVIKALEQVTDANERNRLGVALYGKTFQEIAPAIAEGYSKIAENATKMSAETIAALDRAGDAWDLLKNKIGVAVGESAGFMVKWVEDTSAALSMIGADMSRFTESQRSRIEDAMGQGGEGLAKVLRDIAQARTKDIELTGEQTKASEDYIAQLKAARAELAALTPVQRQQIDAALKLGTSTEEVANKLGLTEEALKLYQEQAKSAEKSTKDLASAKEKASKEAEKFRTSIKNLTSVMAPFAASLQDTETALQEMGASLHDLPSGTIHETAIATEAARKATEEWAEANGARLAPSIRAVGSAAEESTTKVTSFGGSIKSALEDLPNVIMRVFQGGGDLGKSIGSLFGASIFDKESDLVAKMTGKLKGMFGSAFGGAIGSVLPGIGTLLGSGLGSLLDKAFSSLGPKISAFFKKLFGGPSADEVAGRGLVAAFEDQVAGSLNAAQQAEAGGERWKQTVIAIRDAYLAVGRSEREALADAEKLWASSRQGAEASKSVIDEITKKMQEQAEAYGEAGEESADAAERAGDTAEAAIEQAGHESISWIEKIRRALGEIPTELDINIRGNYQAPDLPREEGGEGFASGTLGRTGRFFNNFGSGTPAMLHGMEAVINRQQAIPFAMSMLDGIGSKIGALQPAGASVSANVMLLPVPAGGGADSFQIARDVIRHLPREFDTNSSGLVTRIESLVEDYLRTYGGGRG
jgi:hypothetical protein